MNVNNLLTLIYILFAIDIFAAQCSYPYDFWQNNNSLRPDCACASNKISNFDLEKGLSIGNCVKSIYSTLPIDIMSDNSLYLWLDASDKKGDGIDMFPYIDDDHLEKKASFWQNKRSNSALNKILNNSSKILDSFDHAISYYQSVMIKDNSVSLNFYNDKENIANYSDCPVTIMIIFQIKSQQNYDLLKLNFMTDIIKLSLTANGAINFIYQNQSVNSADNLINIDKKYLITVTNKLGLKNIYLNGNLVITKDDGNNSTINISDWNKINTNITNFVGNLYEIIIYSSDIGDGRRKSLENYLMNKWFD